MLYVKNVPNRERAIRIVMGIVGLAVAAMNWGDSAIVAGAGMVGAIMAMSGLMGFCPMCAIAGRKLDKEQ